MSSFRNTRGKKAANMTPSALFQGNPERRIPFFTLPDRNASIVFLQIRISLCPRARVRPDIVVVLPTALRDHMHFGTMS